MLFPVTKSDAPEGEWNNSSLVNIPSFIVPSEINCARFFFAQEGVDFVSLSLILLPFSTMSIPEQNGLQSGHRVPQ